MLTLFSFTFFSQDLFVTFDILSVEERTLAANQLLKDAKRLKWNVTDSPDPTPSGEYSPAIYMYFVSSQE